MSQSIWTQCAGRFSPLSGSFRRVVESQVVNSTRKLLDSDAEQAVLEDLLDRHAKLPVPAGFEDLHYLLYTPFRHPPLRNGSRFGTRQERGILYGSSDLPTAFAEVAYYRLLFLEGTTADLGVHPTGEVWLWPRSVSATSFTMLTPPSRSTANIWGFTR